MPHDPVTAVEFRLIACAMKAKIGLLQPRDFAELAADALIHASADAELCAAIGEFWQAARRDGNQIAAGHAAHEFLSARGSKAGSADEREIAEQNLLWYQRGPYA